MSVGAMKIARENRSQSIICAWCGISWHSQEWVRYKVGVLTVVVAACRLTPPCRKSKMENKN